MKKIVALGLVLTVSMFSLTGCGSHSDYVTQVNASNTQMMEIWKASEASRMEENRLRLQALSMAMSKAALTPDSGDDVAIAMSFAYASQQKRIDLPQIARVERPNDFVDGIKASVPFLATLAPWFGVAWMADSMANSAGTHYNIGGNSNNVGSSVQGSYSPLTGGEGSTSYSPVIASPTTTDVVPYPLTPDTL